MPSLSSTGGGTLGSSVSASEVEADVATQSELDAVNTALDARIDVLEEPPITAVTDNYTVLAGDVRIHMNAATAKTVTVPTGMSQEFLEVVNLGAGVCTVVAGSSVTFTLGSVTLSQNETGSFEQTSAATWLGYGPAVLLAANNQTGTTYTLALSDAGKCVELNNGSAITLTVPGNASVAFPIGTAIELWQQGAGQVTVAAGGSAVIRSPGSKLKITAQYGSVTLRKRGTDEWALEGNLSA